MKATTLSTIGLAVLLSWLSITAQAQIHQPRQRFVEFAGGLADALPLQGKEGTGYWARVSVGRYSKKEAAWQAGISTQMKYYALATQPDSPAELIRVDQYLAEGSFCPKGFKTRNRAVYVNPGIGILAGYERADYRQLEDGQNLNKALLGLSAGLTTEVNLSHWLSLVLFGKAHYLPTSKVENVHFQYGLGIRFSYFH